jgi:ankyrin repeat protein
MKIHDYAVVGDIAGLAGELAQGVDIEANDTETGFTPLMRALLSQQAGADVPRFLIEKGASLHAVAGAQSLNVLEVALLSGAPAKVALILDAGISVGRSSKQRRVLEYAVRRREIENDPHLIPLLELLLERGLRVHAKHKATRAALLAASYANRFDAIHLLLNAGADAAALKWTPLIAAVALGSVEDVTRVLSEGADLSARDHRKRTAWTLCLELGDLAKAKLLLAAGVDRSEVGRSGQSPLIYAIENEDADFLSWLIEQGFDVNAANDWGRTPLMIALWTDSLEIVRLLLNAGADLDMLDNSGKPPMNYVRSVEMARFLQQFGEDLNDLEDDVRAMLVALENAGQLEVSEAAYRKDKTRRFGKANPELMNLEFWRAMVRCGVPAWKARDKFDDREPVDGPVWCFKRFGKSITELPDGRFIEIGGEHEDFYDPDFCIYNDVIVHHGGKFDIFGYPWEVFPPTDFHTATLFGKYIYIVGALSYPDIRRYGDTPVYRLNTEDYSMEEVPTTGEKPGWISRHRASLDETELYIYGGKVYSYENGEYDYTDNDETFILNLETLVWSRVENAPQ